MMTASKQATQELQRVLLPIGIISVVTNLLMLTLPIYMLQIYDRVLTSRNIATLVMLSLLAAVFLAVGSYLNYLRSRIAERLAIRFEQRLAGTVFAAELQGGHGAGEPSSKKLVDDLDTIRQFLSGSGLAGMFDMPWVPIFILLLAILHPLLGATAFAASCILLIVGLCSSWFSRSRVDEAKAATEHADRFLVVARRQQDVLRAMSMGASIGQRWHRHRLKGLGLLVEGNDITSAFKAISTFVRQLAQMAMLGFGAFLAIYDVITPGVIVAGSIICARALGPLDQAFNTIKTGRRAFAAFGRLRASTEDVVDPAALAPLPKPWGRLQVDDVTITFEGQAKPALRNISFVLEAGRTLGVVGPAGAGKSVLARLLVGAASPNTGHVSLGGHNLYRDNDGRLGEHIGYVAQTLSLIEGSVLDNITRFQAIDANWAVQASERVGIHGLIEKLPQRYDTPIRVAARRMTPSHLRMIEFARAICGNPTLLVLDKPDAGLDNAGLHALQRLIADARGNGLTLVVISDRPALVRSFDDLLVLWNGTMEGIVKPEKLMSGMQQTKRVTGAA